MIALVSPNLMVQRSDRFTTGIVYMPIGLAHVAAAMREAGLALRVIDAFAAAPGRRRIDGGFAVFGLAPADVVRRIGDARVVFIFANQLINHAAMVAIVSAQKAARPGVPIVVLENTQAVTAYAVQPIAPELFAAGADIVLAGEPERRAVALARALLDGDDAAIADIDGASTPEICNPPRGFNRDLDALPLPAWDLFPLDAYWDLRFGHGPQSEPKYLPLLTSRGCPYPCRFCVVPATNSRSWRARSARNVVDEMEHWLHRLGVREFHIEDLNPTVQDRRTRAICQEIIDRGLDVTWKLVAGTKVETIRDEETIALMAQAGCRYISISPESGSARVLKLIDKPFEADHAVRLIRAMNTHGICSQACFVLGFPGETDRDRQQTWDMVRDLTREGVDEIALFMVSPVPGSAIYDGYAGAGFTSLSELSFTPTWREDYAALSRFRLRLYGAFLAWKLLYHPRKYLRHAPNLARRRFETKMEMVPYKALHWAAMERLGRTP